MDNRIGNLIIKVLKDNYTTGEGAELDAWKAMSPVNAGVLKILTDPQQLKKAIIRKDWRWLSVRIGVGFTHFDGKPVPWPHKHSQRWLIEQFANRAWDEPIIDRAQIVFCLDATIQEMVEHLLELRRQGECYDTIAAILDILAVAYNTTLLPEGHPDEAKEAFKAIMAMLE
jgi:hypothetical protein